MDKLNGTFFLKKSNAAENYLQKLEERRIESKDERKSIEGEIKRVQAGIRGEQNVAYQLKYCQLPLYVLHDVFLEENILGENLSAQIDYLVFTKKICFIIECKNLGGQIRIVGNDFIQEFKNGDAKKIDSPITQNQNHLETIRKIVLKYARGWEKRRMEKRFDDYYKSIVVIANSKTRILLEDANPEIEKQVVHVEQLGAYIKEQYEKSGIREKSDSKLKAWACGFFELHKEREMDYTEKCIKPLTVQPNTQVEEKHNDMERDYKDDEYKKCENDLCSELKAYRKSKAKEKNYKANYYIYTDETVEQLIRKKPKSREELLKIKGFSVKRVEEYGEDILKIISKFI